MDLGAGVSSTMTGSLFAQGPILEPCICDHVLRLDRWSVTVAAEKLVAMRTVNLSWANETLLIPDAAFSGPDLRLLVAGRLPLRAPMKLRVTGDGSLSALALVSSRVSRGSGALKFGLEVGGTVLKPALDGELTVANGELLLAGQKRPATGINGRVTFNGAAANIDSARFEYGGGPVALGGQLVVGGEGGAEASIRADFDRVSLDPADDIDATVSGNLILLGPIDDLRLRGNVVIDKLSYTRNVNLTSIIPRRGSRPPLNVPAVESTEAIGLGIKITADETISFSNNVLDARFNADLTLTGTSNRMGLLGTVTPVAAKARYAGNLYELERGSIDFTEEYEIYSRFSLRATTDACGIDVTVDVFGDSESYSVSPSGTDDTGVVDPQEVLVCLQFGARQRDFSSGAPVTSSAVGGVDDELAAAVSGIDALWTVSGL
ncbi:MAG: translocation/assembly module TamB domain-containing protein, partial [Myxococcota bacterium]